MRQRAEEELKESSNSNIIYSCANSSMPASRSSSSMLMISTSSLKYVSSSSSSSNLNHVLGNSCKPNSTLSCNESAEFALNCTIPEPSSSPVTVINSSDTKPSITPIMLEKQLFDDSLLRFWRTGCLFNAWDSREDD